MANLLNQITVGDIKVLVLDANPSTSPGYDAELASLALVEGAPGLWQKVGTGATDWLLISATAENIEDVVASVLQGATGQITITHNDPADTITIGLADTSVPPGSYGSASQVGTFTVDAKGRLTAASNTSINITSSQVSDFTEAAQDAVGGALVDSTTIDFTYNDAANTITAEVIESGITHGHLSGLSADDHVQYLFLGGRTGGQSVNGGAASGENLTLSSTAHGVKGHIRLGANATFDENNTRLGIGTVSPQSILHLVSGSLQYNYILNSTTTTDATPTTIASLTTVNDSVELIKVFVTGIKTNTPSLNDSCAFERTFRIRNNGGTVSVLTFQSDYTSRDGALSATNISTVVSGATVDIRVTGVTGANITWKAIVQRMR